MWPNVIMQTLYILPSGEMYERLQVQRMKLSAQSVEMVALGLSAVKSFSESAQ